MKYLEKLHNKLEKEIPNQIEVIRYAQKYKIPIFIA